MKYFQVKKGFAIALAIATGISATAYGAPTFKDVPSTHWAYSAISAVADRGLMSSDISGNYKPNELIDKFETIKILAKAAGYKYDNVSQAEQDYYNKCYEKNKTFLSQFSNKFTKWNTSADREIAFLIEKGVVVEQDLNQFVIIKDNKEQLRALSRGECAVFITKMLGKNSQALLDTYPHDYADDARIPSDIKPYAYFMKNMGIIKGNDSAGNFAHEVAISRATMAVILDRALGLSSAISIGTTAPTPIPTPTPTTVTTAVTTVSGTIDKFYPSLKAIQILSSTGSKEIIKMSDTIAVYIDGQLRSSSDLKEGMTVVGVVNNGSLTDIRATSGTTVVTPTPAPTTTTTTTTTPSTTGGTTTGANYITLDGTVATLSDATKTIGVEIKMVNPRDGSILSEVRTLTLAPTCSIVRGDVPISLAEVVKGDIASVEISGNTVYRISVEQRVVELKDGTLLAKKYNDSTGSVTLSIKDNREKTYELRVASGTTITRKGIGVTSWDQLRVGDMIDCKAEYGVLTAVTAYGVLSTTDGWIEEISIGKQQSHIVLRDTDNVVKKFYLILNSTDAYSLRVGNKVRVRLDSQEVSTVMLLEEVSTNIVTGYINTIKSGIVTLRDSQPYGTNGKRDVVLDGSTVYTNSITGEKVAYNALREGQRVYIVFQNVLSNVAKTVTILVE